MTGEHQHVEAPAKNQLIWAPHCPVIQIHQKPAYPLMQCSPLVSWILTKEIIVTLTVFTFQASFPSSRTALKSAAKPLPHCQLGLLTLAPWATLGFFLCVCFLNTVQSRLCPIMF